jgi:hypothetical protein
MSWYGTLLLARPTGGALSALPEVRRSFGSRFLPSSSWGNTLGLYDLGDGWQRVSVGPIHGERVRLAAGVRALVAVTSAPVLAAWVSGSDCAHLECRTPGGVSLSLHLPNDTEACGYEHLDGRPRWLRPHLAAAELEDWAGEAGRTPSIDDISAIVNGEWNEQPWMEHRVLALFGALGFPPGTEIQPAVSPPEGTTAGG